MRSQESGVRSQESEVRSQESGVRSQEFRSQESEEGISPRTPLLPALYTLSPGVSKSSCCLRRCLTPSKFSSTWARMLVNVAEPSNLFMNSSSIFRYFYENITSRYYRD
ncbi:MAG: hypothetical protein HEP80_11575 [Dolichospermum sp. UKL201]|nr:MAG: hypothetical protein HEP80_11575 [Dolichospermum sp. UKL201]